MWTQVTFESDQQTILAPLSHFEEKEKVQRELEEKRVRKHYLVFWSPVLTDTPEKLLKREGKILQQDLVKSDYRSKKPVAGWYKATLKQWADSLEELEKILVEPAGRKKKEAALIVEPKEKKLEEKKNTKLLKEAARKKARVSSLKRTKIHSSRSESGESVDGDDVPFWEQKESSDAFSVLKDENKKIKKENESLRKINDKLVELNVYWQEEVKKLNRHSRKRHSDETPKSDHRLQSKRILLSPAPTSNTKASPNNNVEVKEVIPTLSPVPTSPMNDLGVEELVTEAAEVEEESVIHQPLSIPSKEAIQPEKESHGPGSSQNVPSPYNKENTPLFNGQSSSGTSVNKGKSGKSGKSSVTLGGIKLEEGEFTIKPPEGVSCIDFGRFMSIADSVAAGEQGDSQFYKNCAALLWEDMDLATRSVTGAGCPNDLSRAAKKECSPSKKQYLKELLELRIRKQLFTVPEADVQKRLNYTVVNGYLRQKIKTVTRYLKNKGQL